MKRIGYRSRLFLILALFAFVPAIVLTLAWSGTTAWLLPRLSGTSAWDSVAVSGAKALEAARRGPHTDEELQALADHERQLATSVSYAHRSEYLTKRFVPLLIIAGLLSLGFLTLLTSRAAGHLSRQLSRPLHELVGWTELIRRGDPLPATADARGAPEFGVLREEMRQMATDVEAGRRAAIEAERLAAFRESARQVAHELKNPLTPIRFAVDQLKRGVPPELADAVAVLATESARLETMARSFAQFGKLPEGPPSDVDVADLVRAAARTSVPSHLSYTVEAEPDVPLLHAHHDALSRAVGNVLLNAVDACGASGTIAARISSRSEGGRREIAIAVRDDGVGIAPERINSIFEPYVTDKTGGTGLGLAIVKQTVVAHGGRVEAESVRGSGTEIRLIFPAGSNESEA
ncbi:MAG TPA: HAMP domain-containing sensor histidine kinase [Gemmatimonadaceae bacterium]|nr:HAMP domain-containing sensor histidine kinase [Gemmatimonadaceae bacterium]